MLAKLRDRCDFQTLSCLHIKDYLNIIALNLVLQEFYKT